MVRPATADIDTEPVKQSRLHWEPVLQKAGTPGGRGSQTSAAGEFRPSMAWMANIESSARVFSPL